MPFGKGMSMDLQVYAGPLNGASRAVVLFNRHAIGTQYPISNITVTWEQVGFDSDVEAIVRDLHAEKDLGTFTESFTGAVDIHDARMLRITPRHVKDEYDNWRPWSEENKALQAEVRSMLRVGPPMHPKAARAAYARQHTQ